VCPLCMGQGLTKEYYGYREMTVRALSPRCKCSPAAAAPHWVVGVWGVRVKAIAGCCEVVSALPAHPKPSCGARAEALRALRR
jgi:hypothetical protein